ncbi:methylated-DNA--[protein]-cysteine S-methyltransferase [Cohnella boryungensis]|uniref:Methylated-DNA--protein-cysteine methyltransferase n=1 Tax=Cohnella boryungensis TaxID=768479 RepID=A0ABV8SBS6_9BACL
MTASAKSPIYWSLTTYGDWSLYLAATAAGLTYVGSPNQPFEQLSAWVDARHPGKTLIRSDDHLHPYASQLADYFQGSLQRFTISVDLPGTPFQQAVWDALQRIPYGRTCSYSDIAEAIERPAAVRAVGAAIGANPVLITVPCHRVIGKGGALTGYRGGMEMKVKLLQLEQGEQ